MTFVTVSTSVEVEVDLSEIDDDDLLQELDSRNLDGSGALISSKDDIQAMYYAFYFGKTAEAMAIARKVAQDVTGKVIP